MVLKKATVRRSVSKACAKIKGKKRMKPYSYNLTNVGRELMTILNVRATKNNKLLFSRVLRRMILERPATKKSSNNLRKEFMGLRNEVASRMAKYSGKGLVEVKSKHINLLRNMEYFLREGYALPQEKAILEGLKSNKKIEEAMKKLGGKNSEYPLNDIVKAALESKLGGQSVAFAFNSAVNISNKRYKVSERTKRDYASFFIIAFKEELNSMKRR